MNILSYFFVTLFIWTPISFASEVGDSSINHDRPKTARPRRKTILATESPNSSVTISSKGAKRKQAPECFQAPETLKDTKNPEAEIEALFRGLNDDEVQARLVLAESLASGPKCMAGSEKNGIFQGVAWVVANRIRHPNAAYGQGRKALFKKFQFRSSFGSCDVAQRQALLCPSSIGQGWEASWNLATQAVNNTKKNANNPLQGIHHYYFGQHFDNSNTCAKWRGVKPDWAIPSAQRQADIAEIKPESNCLEFFEVK